MTKTDYFRLHQQCLSNGTSSRQIKSDLIFCHLHKRYCSMMLCISKDTINKHLKTAENTDKV